VVVAHLGAPEYAEFLRWPSGYERVHLDTTMVFTDFFDADGGLPDRPAAAAADLQDKVLLGSDFPTIPYPYAHQLEGLARLGFGERLAARRLLGQRCPLFGFGGECAAPPLTPVDWGDGLRATTQEGLIGFDLGR
jgi:hypothetical protein